MFRTVVKFDSVFSILQRGQLADLIDSDDARAMNPYELGSVKSLYQGRQGLSQEMCRTLHMKFHVILGSCNP
jgi:hypothetical protein